MIPVKKHQNPVKNPNQEIDNYKSKPTTTPAAPVTTEPNDPLTKYYGSGSEALGQSYRNQQNVLDESKNAALQSAYVSNEVLKKYLPQQNKANGLYGLGVSESAAIDAHNSYVSNVGKIQQEYAANSAALLENYRQAKQAEQDSAYQEAMAMIESGTYTDAENLDQYLSSMQGRVSAEQYANLEQLANYYKADLEDEADKPTPYVKNDVTFYKNDWFGATDLSSGDNITVKVGDRTLGVESRGEVTDAEIVEAADSIQNNQIFWLGGKIYYKVNGKIYLIGGRGGNDAANDYTELYKQFAYGEDTDYTQRSSGGRNQ